MILTYIHFAMAVFCGLCAWQNKRPEPLLPRLSRPSHEDAFCTLLAASMAVKGFGQILIQLTGATTGAEICLSIANGVVAICLVSRMKFKQT